MERLEHGLHPLITFVIMPLFALANAGVGITTGVGAMLVDPVVLGVFFGLVLGKQAGIMFFAWLAVRSGLATLPPDIRWFQLYGAAWLGGIGFTMSLFIAELAFPHSSELVPAKLGILAASLVAGLVGAAIVRAASARSGPRRGGHAGQIAGRLIGENRGRSGSSPGQTPSGPVYAPADGASTSTRNGVLALPM
jgi:NhaA family Na+:H+ antiporter